VWSERTFEQWKNAAAGVWSRREWGVREGMGGFFEIGKCMN